MTTRFVVATVALAFLALLAGYNLASRQLESATAPPPRAISIDHKQALAGWSFADIDGNQRALSEWAENIVVLNFWATWCPPCLKEIPIFITMQTRFGDQGVQFIGIALDQVDAVRQFAANTGVNYPLLLGEEKVTDYMRGLGNNIGALPFSALISRDGEVLAIHHGEWSEADLSAAIEAAL